MSFEPQKDSFIWTNWLDFQKKKLAARWFKVTFLGWLSDLFKWLSDLQLGDKKVTKNHLAVFVSGRNENHGELYRCQPNCWKNLGLTVTIRRPKGPWKKKFERLIFPAKYVIPKSLKFSHWPSKLYIEQYIPSLKFNSEFTPEIQDGTGRLSPADAFLRDYEAK